MTLTDEFVECFKTDEDCTGGTARIVAMGLLPEGVDGDDPRVEAVIERCRKIRDKEEQKAKP